MELLTAAEGLWRGEPYSDWPDAEFATGERRRLAEVHAAAHAALLEARLESGDAPGVVAELERLVVEEPLREPWWRLLMLALYRAGRQADALAAGRRARSVLAEELGADPGPALRAMETAILAQEPALDRVPTPVPDRGLRHAEPAGAVAPGACPYKGLAAYQTSDAAMFHGRRRLVSVAAGLDGRSVQEDQAPHRSRSRRAPARVGRWGAPAASASNPCSAPTSTAFP